MTERPKTPDRRPAEPLLTLAIARDDEGGDPLREELEQLRPAGHVELERLQSTLAERMFGASNDPPRIERFILLGRLGAGGMGVVYSAYDPHLDRRVALKLLRDSDRVRQVERERLLREAHALARISHPNVVTVHEVGQLGGQVFVVMEFVVGQTLDAWVRAKPRAWREVLEVYLQAGRGLAAAHAAGIVHRDFKPQNAIMGDDGRVRVVDFGLARGEHGASSDEARAVAGQDDPAVSSSGASVIPAAGFDASLTRPNVLVGTPAYMSPEQYSRRVVGPASDQFSFCVALYEALVGARPFTGDTPAELANQIVEGSVREPPRGTRVPAWLLTTLRRGLSVRPRDRYRSMDELLVALARDPARTRRRWLVGAGAVALASVAAAKLLQAPAAEPPCQGSAAALADAWSPARRSALQDHFEGLPTPDADVVGARVLDTVDAYAERWQQMHEDACLAHRRGEQSGALLDKRMNCLDRRRAALAGVVDVLGAADLKAFENAAFMVYDLPPVHACGDTDVLEAELPLPEDPEVASAVAEGREGLARAGTLAKAGQIDAAYRLADEWVARARGLAYPPLIAEALLVRGRVEMVGGRVDVRQGNGDGSRPSATLLEAFHAGLAAKSDTVATEALVRRLYMEAIRPDGRSIQESEDYGLVHALLDRLPDSSAVRGLFLNNAGSIAAARGDFAAARTYLRQALEVKQNAPEVNPIDVLETRFNLALMAEDETSQMAGLEWALEGFERELGPTHPHTFSARMVLAHSMRDPAAARQRFAELCATYERNYPDSRDGLAACLYDAATWAQEVGAVEEAVATFERIAVLLDGPGESSLRSLRRAIARSAALHLRGRDVELVGELQQLLDELGRSELPRWLDTFVAELQVALGRSLVAAGRPSEAIAELRPAIEVLAQASTARVDHATERILARARLLLVHAALDARERDPATAADPPSASRREDELLDAAEAWYRESGPGYTPKLREIRDLRARLASR